MWCYWPARFQLLLQQTFFSRLVNHNPATAFGRRTLKWWLLALLSAAIPVATFYPLFSIAGAALPASAWLPQSITNQIMCWALVNGAVAFIISRIAGGGFRSPSQPLLPALLIALITAGIGYAAVVFIDLVFLVDPRFWFVGVKALSLGQFKMALVYLAPFTVYFLLALRSVHLGMSVDGDRAWQMYAANAFMLMGGFAVFLLLQYTMLFTTGMLLTPAEPLNTIIMIQFVPLLLIVAIISTFCYRRTGSYLTGALISSLFVTWYIVAGQATQFAA